jgi:hypothetical protein
MRRLELVVSVIAVLAIRSVPVSASSVEPASPVPVARASEPELANQSAQEALAEDVALVAEANDWTVAEANTHYEVSVAAGLLAEQMADERSTVYVGAALSTEPGGAPTVYVKGRADAKVRSLIEESGIEVILADRQPFSFAELEDRKLRVHHALEALGFPSVATSVNITGGGEIPASVSVGPNTPRAIADIVRALPPDLRSSVRLTVSERPVVSDEQAFGGMWMRDNGLNQCTSGFSVLHANTNVLGVATAGHCPQIDQIDHPGHGLHATVFRAQHRGVWGDAEWYSTSEPEPDDFYADAGNVIRDVAAVEPRANILVNEPVCQYGRSSNDRDCSLEVQDVSQSCTNGGVFNDRLVLMNGDTGIGGDSGGPWSFGGTAFGLHKGNCAPDFAHLEVWTVADLLDEALGVRVTCGC